MSATCEPPRISVEAWPAGGWVVRVEGEPTPISWHDTEEEALFRARAYRRARGRGQELALGPDG